MPFVFVFLNIQSMSKSNLSFMLRQEHMEAAADFRESQGPKKKQTPLPGWDGSSGGPHGNPLGAWPVQIVLSVDGERVVTVGG